VHDVLAVSESMGGCSLVASGSAAPAALHAALLDGRILDLTIEGGIPSWASVVRVPMTQNQLTNVVPGALQFYDLPDLAAMIAPRKLTIRNPVDPTGKPVTQTELEAIYAGARAAYKAAGAEGNLTLQGAP
jgi:hypothetical protein